VDANADEAGPHAGRLHGAVDFAVLVHVVELEHEDVLQGDGIAFHAGALRHVRDAAGTVLETLHLDEEVDGRRDLLADGTSRQLHAGHEDHVLEAGKGVARVVGVNG
jgi:hypothetical protein